MLLALRVRLDGEVVGEDTIRVRVAPFEVLSNCDVAETLFVSNIGDAPWTAFEADMVAAATGIVDVVTNDVPIAFCQDKTEFGWSGLGVSGQPNVWSLDEEAFISLLSSGTGWFARPLANGWGGNIEASPPTALHPHGRIIVGTNLPEHAKAFLKSQEVQTDGGELLELPVSRLKVGHVDEVMTILPKPDGSFAVAVADVLLGVSLLSAEREEIRELVEDEGQENLRSYLNMIDGALSPFFNPSFSGKLSNIRCDLQEIKTRLKSGLGLGDDDLVPIPVLFAPKDTGEGTGGLAIAKSPNPVNLACLMSRTGTKKLLVPDPIFDSFCASICASLEGIGFEEDEIAMVWTEGPHDADGEAHCGSNVLRRRTP